MMTPHRKQVLKRDRSLVREDSAGRSYPCSLDVSIHDYV